MENRDDNLPISRMLIEAIIENIEKGQKHRKSATAAPTNKPVPVTPSAVLTIA